jgi:hypothetical protein
MNESIRTLENAIKEAKNAIVNAMMKVVMEHGYDFHDSYDYYYNDFGIVEEEYEENTKVLKIVDMFNNGGCCFPHAYMYHQTIPTDDKESVTEWCSLAFWGLYAVKENNILRLKYYVLYHEGMEYDSDISEPDHDYVESLSLDELEKLSQYLLEYVSQRGQHTI